MRIFIRRIVYYVFALWLSGNLITSLSISGNLWGMLSAGVALAVMMMVLKPLLSLLFFPINMLTLGLMGWLVNVAVLYLWSVFVPNVSISAWTFPGLSSDWLTLSPVSLSLPWTLVILSFAISLIVSGLEKLGDE
jgi:putative membrane protein